MAINEGGQEIVRLCFYTALATDSQGNLVTNRGYRAYGRYRTGGTLPTDHGFTGHKQDNTGLIDMNARYYVPEIGQFIGCPLGADTIVPDPTVLIDYNRFAYARANPLLYNDPSGNFPETIWDAANVVMGTASLGYNVWHGNWGDAAWDAGGLVVDVGATIVPFIPGGAATAIKVGRAANRATEVILATTRASRRAVRHGDELAGLAPVSKHILTESMQRYRNQTFSVAGENFILNRENMERILSRHHPKYWGAAGTRQARMNTSFDGTLSIDDIADIAQQVVEAGYQSRSPIRENSSTYKYVAEIDGNWFEAIVESTSQGPRRHSPGQIVHFTPLNTRP